MRIGFIGAGRMAEAMIAALIRTGAARAGALRASDPDPARRRVAAALGIEALESNDELARASDVVFLCVKPQGLDAVLRELARSLGPEHLVISIAAGKRIALIEGLLPHARVIRVMPNVACLAGEGMCAFAAGGRATDADRQTAARLLGAFGKTVELREDLLDAVTAVSGSGPAFFAYFVERIVEGGVAEGLTREQALLLARQTMLGTARLLAEGPMEPADLIQSVASAKGTTAEGLGVLERSDFGSIVHGVIRAAARRSRELSTASS